MLKKETNLENKKIYSFSFDSVEELLSYIEKTPYAKEYWKKESNLLSRNTGDKDFCKFADSASLEEAIDVCRSGDFRDVGKIFEISNQMNFDVPNSLNKRKSEIGYHGFRPDVHRNIVGHPKQMYRIVRDESKKFINIYFNIANSSKDVKEQIYNKGIITLKLIELLEKLNYRVNFNFFYIAKQPQYLNDTEYLYVTINVKRFNEKIDPNICYFPICHPAFSRRIISSLTETINFGNDEWRNSYGKIVGNDEIIEFLNLSDQDILVNFNKDLGIEGKNLLIDMKNYFSTINFEEYLDGEQMIFDDKSKTFSLVKSKTKR